VEQEVSHVTQVRFIKETTYTTWLANVVMVKKSNGKWQMCMDYTDLNKACSKDTYLLSNIDQLIDSTSGDEMLNFLDAYLGYNQIRMYTPDEDKMTFMIERSNYCYKSSHLASRM